jgi:uncharacterized protein YycO
METLKIEIQRMWNVKAKVTPTITGTTGTISKSLRQYLSNIPGKHEIKELQKKKKKKKKRNFFHIKKNRKKKKEKRKTLL